MAIGTNISPHKQCLTEQQLLALAQHRLPKHEAAALKKHLADCELCTDALEGVRFMDDPDQLPTIIAQINGEVRAKGMAKPKVIRFPTAGIIGIAASVCLLIGFFFLFDEGGLKQANDSFALESTQATESLEEAPLRVEDSLTQASDLADETSNEKSKRIFSRKKEKTVYLEKGEERKVSASSPKKQEEVLLEEEASEESAANPVKAKNHQAKPPPSPTLTESNEQKLAEGEVDDIAATGRGFAKDDEMIAGAEGTQNHARTALSSPPLPAVVMATYQHPDFNKKQNKLMRQAMEAFNEGKLDDAADKFDRLLAEMPQSRVANYLAGINYLYLNQPAKARERLMIVAKRQGEVAFESVDWPSILQLLKNGQNEEAKRLVQTYTQSEGLIRFR